MKEFLYLCQIQILGRDCFILCLFLQEMRLVILSNCAKILTLLPCYLNEKEIFLQIFIQLRSNLYLSFLFFFWYLSFLFFFPLSICDCSAKLLVCQINMYIFFKFRQKYLQGNVTLLFLFIFEHHKLKENKICIFFFILGSFLNCLQFKYGLGKGKCQIIKQYSNMLLTSPIDEMGGGAKCNAIIY